MYYYVSMHNRADSNFAAMSLVTNIHSVSREYNCQLNLFFALDNFQNTKPSNDNTDMGKLIQCLILIFVYVQCINIFEC